MIRLFGMTVFVQAYAPGICWFFLYQSRPEYRAHLFRFMGLTLVVAGSERIST